MARSIPFFEAVPAGSADQATARLSAAARAHREAVPPIDGLPPELARLVLDYRVELAALAGQDPSRPPSAEAIADHAERLAALCRRLDAALAALEAAEKPH